MQLVTIPQIENCLKKLSTDKLIVVYDFVSYLLKRDENLWQHKEISDTYQTMIASEAVLRRDWDRPEEDEAWKDL